MLKLNRSKMALWLILFAAAILGAVVGYFKAEQADLITQNPEIVAMIVIVFVVLMIAFTIVWWKSVDEAVREAHKWAWYWGGSGGLLIVMPVYFLSMVTGGAFGESLMTYFDTNLPPFEFGIMLTLIPLVIGYILAWGIWWLRHR